MKTTAGELAELVGGQLLGDPETEVLGIATVDEAVKGDLVLAENQRYLWRAVASEASCIITAVGLGEASANKCVIETANPGEAFRKALELFAPEEWVPSVGVGKGTIIEPGVDLGRNVAIGANCYVGRGASLGDGCVLFPNVYIGEGVEIGRNTKIYPGVMVGARCKVGERVILHPGVVIGADGFGYAPSESGLAKMPHVGTVTVGNDVEIGANSAIDRAKTGATVIGDGTKIDNLVHIAHNVKIGRNCIIVALSGVAGSAEIGNGVTLAAQTGVKDHVRIEDGTVVAARSGVIGDLPKGSMVSGFPARDHRTEKRVEAVRLHLPEILDRLRALENEVKALRAKENSECNGNIEL